MKKNVAILFGGDSSEYVISERSAVQIYNVLKSATYNIFRIRIKGNKWYYLDEEGKEHPVDLNDFSLKLSGKKKITFEFAFIIIHGTPGEDGKLQAYLDLQKIPYNTPGLFVSALTFNKYACKLYLRNYGILSPESVLYAKEQEIDERNILEQTKVIPDLKLDSLMKVELIVRIEDEFGVVIDETKISSKTTVVQLQDIIDTAEPGKKISPLKSWPRWWWIRLIRVIVQFILFSITRTFVRLRIEGKQNLKDLSLPVIFMPNHLSYADPVVVAMALPHKIRRRISFAAARDVLYEYYSHLVFPVELTGNSFPLPRLEGENIRLGMGKMLDEKYSVVIFPEGKMSKTGELLPLKRGAGFVAVEMNCYIVPVRLYGTAEIVPYGKFMPCKRGIVRVVFGKPIKFKKSDSYHYATKEIEAALKEL